MPKAVFLEATSFYEVLDAPSICLERLSLHANGVHAFSNSSMAQRLTGRHSGAFLFGPAFTPCFGFLNLTRGIDPAPPGGLGEHGRRHGAPKA
jgi:hypothetical protein